MRPLRKSLRILCGYIFYRKAHKANAQRFAKFLPASLNASTIVVSSFIPKIPPNSLK